MLSSPSVKDDYIPFYLVLTVRQSDCTVICCETNAKQTHAICQISFCHTGIKSLVYFTVSQVTSPKLNSVLPLNYEFLPGSCDIIRQAIK